MYRIVEIQKVSSFTPKKDICLIPYEGFGNVAITVPIGSLVEGEKIIYCDNCPINVDIMVKNHANKCLILDDEKTKTMTIFPSQWIAPGEYRFCHCGTRLIPLTAKICGVCDPAGDKTVADKVHKLLAGERYLLAARRRDAGMKPLFWLNQS